MIKISPEILPIFRGWTGAQGAVHADGLVACEAPILQEASVPLRASERDDWSRVRPSGRQIGVMFTNLAILGASHCMNLY